MKQVCMYLRKSRADEEAEKYGKNETLLKHKKILLKIAKEMNLNIIKIHQEIVSGESLIHRPEMIKLLKEVEQNMYDAILCIDIDRLGRGNMQEQGLILETFKKSNTKIITPRKTYNLQNEFDEEYSEFEAFMARKELKIINRRLQRGRIRSIEDGNYIGALPPYGYQITHIDKYRTLKPHPQQAPIVEMIFNLYVNHGLGSNKIANKLNQLGYKSYTGKKWSNTSILTIIKNEVYTGKVQWRKKKYKKSKKPNQIKEVKNLPRNQWISVSGKHKSLISQEMYLKAQKILSQRNHIPYNTKVVNPLAGLIKCQICGSSMVYRTYTNNIDPHIICYNRNKCNNKSSKFKYVEKNLLRGLEKWLENYKINLNQIKNNNHSSNTLTLYKISLSKLNKQLQEFEEQKNNLHDLLERKIYDDKTYIQRYKIIDQQIKNIRQNIKETKIDMQIEKEKTQSQINSIPKVKHLLDIYTQTKSPYKKNMLLKSILNYAVYKKDKSQRNDEFTLILYPKLPKLPK